jgi:hypothetical protein
MSSRMSILRCVDWPVLTRSVLVRLNRYTHDVCPQAILARPWAAIDLLYATNFEGKRQTSACSRRTMHELLFLASDYHNWLNQASQSNAMSVSYFGTCLTPGVFLSLKLSL